MTKIRRHTRRATEALPDHFMCRLLLGLMAVIAFGMKARAEVTVLLEQPYGKLGILEPAGHTALYLDRVCAATPTELRSCHSGELGVVLSRYDGIDGKDWVAMPLLPYLYSVKNERDIPASVDQRDVADLRNAYRRRWLADLAPDREDGSAPPGNWYELVGAAYDRTIYGFSVPTTAEQDARVIALLNDHANVERYNGFSRNCADFVRTTLNLIYPHAVRRNWIADLGMTSPKSVARGLTHYAKKHPAVDLTVFVVPQVSGSLPRSFSNVCFAEGVLKRLGLPLIVISPWATGAVLAAWVGHGRFSVPRDAAPLDIAELRAKLEYARPLWTQPPNIPAPVLQPVAIETPAATAHRGAPGLSVDAAPAVLAISTAAFR